MWNIYWSTDPINVHQVIWAYNTYMSFERHICGWHIFCSNMVTKCCSLLIFNGNVDYRRSVVGHNLQCGRHIHSGAYASNVECMYTHAPGHIVHYSEFI